MDFLRAHPVVCATQEEIKIYTRDFDAVKKAADNYVVWFNAHFQELENYELEVQAALPEKRLRR